MCPSHPALGRANHAEAFWGWGGGDAARRAAAGPTHVARGLEPLNTTPRALEWRLASHRGTEKEEVKRTTTSSSNNQPITELSVHGLTSPDPTSLRFRCLPQHGTVYYV